MRSVVLLVVNMVFENVFASMANKLLGSYIEKINSQDMSFGLGGMLTV